MENLNWKKIGNGNDFQNLVNDLFALIINRPGFLSSNPEIGADGGWDGRYDGSFMGLNGVWNFQAKWTKHNLNDAYKQLHTEVKEELVKAKKNKVKYLLIATNADLRVGTDDHIGRLEKLNNDGEFVEQLFIWSKADLERRIIQRPLIRYLHFGYPQEPMFVPPHMFIAGEQSISGSLIGREKSLNSLAKSLNDFKSRVFIFHASGGYGKTHFIFELAKKISSESNVQVYFCRPGIRDVNDAINELDHEKDTLVFLDDAERYLEETKKLIAHTKTFSPGKLKIILSCRSSGKEIINNMASSQGVSIDHDSNLELPKLSEKELVNILTRTAKPNKAKHPERTVKELNGNLFLITTIGKIIKGGEVDPKHIKKQIKDHLADETSKALNSLLNEQEAKNLLRELSIIVPFSRNENNNTIEKLSEILGIEVDKLNEAIDRLKDTNVLRMVGSSIRFNPDMKGDIYLSTELDGRNGKSLVNKFFENWLAVRPKQLTANLADAFRHRDTDTASEAVRELIKKWISETSKTKKENKYNRLKLIAPVAFLAPEEIINLIHAYLDSSPDTDDIYSLNRDTYGPIIYQILHIQGLEEAVSKLILKIAQKNLKGTYDNYTPDRMIRQIVSPIEVNINSATKSLSELLSWIKKENSTEVEAGLVSKGALESLSGSHEYSESYGNQITFGKKILIYKGEHKKRVNAFRNTGMEVLKNLVFHTKDKIKIKGINIINDIDRGDAAVGKEFQARVLADKVQILNWLKKLISKTKSHEVLSSVEDVLVRYWAINQDLSDKAASVLRKFPRSVEYVIFQYFVSHDVIISDFVKIEKGAPKNDKWSWLVNEHFRLRDFNQKDLDDVVKKLSVKYKSDKEIIDYLNRLDREITDITQWQYVPLIETWAKFNKKFFISATDNQALFKKIPERFHRGVYRVASDKNKKYIKDYAEKILADLDHLDLQSVDNLLDLITRHNPPAKEFMPWLIKIIKKSDSNIKSLILHRSYFIFQDREQTEKNQAIMIIEFCLDGVVENRLLDMLDFLLHHTVEWKIPDSSLNKVRLKLFEITKNISSIDYHADKLIGFAIGESLSKFIELVEHRLQKYRSSLEEKPSVHFDAIPFNGFKSAKDLVKSYDDFSKLMDKINFWRKENLIYSFDVDNLLKNIKGQNREYLEAYIEEKIKKGTKESVGIASNALLGVPFSNNTANLFLNLLLSADKIGFIEDARDIFTRQVLTGSYSSKVGEAPPALLDKKEGLLKIHKQCPPGIIKDHIDSLIKSIGDDIQRNIDEGQEILFPKH